MKGRGKPKPPMAMIRKKAKMEGESVAKEKREMMGKRGKSDMAMLKRRRMPA